MSLNGTGVCAGVLEPKFYPKTSDFANTIYFPSKTPAAGVAYGTLLLYSNEDYLVNFYLQGVSDATELILQ